MEEESNKAEESCNQKEMLELYKIHAELEDRGRQRREGANRLYAGLITGVFIFCAAVVRFGEGGTHGSLIIILGVLGIYLSVCWIYTIKDYQLMQEIKIDNLNKMEEYFLFRPFQKELEFFKKYLHNKKFIRMSGVEFLPRIFFLFSCVILSYGIVWSLVI